MTSAIQMSDTPKHPAGITCCLSLICIVITGPIALIWGLLKPSEDPKFRCEFYDSKYGVLIKVIPLPGTEIPNGRIGAQIDLRRQFKMTNNSVTLISTNTDILLDRLWGEGYVPTYVYDVDHSKVSAGHGVLWLLCPASGRSIQVSVNDMGATKLSCPPAEECQRRADIEGVAGLINAPKLLDPNDVWRFEKRKESADKGDILAQYSLAICFEEGSGVAKHATEATKWYRKAADQGHNLSQYRLAYCYAEGRGVPKDMVEAYAYFCMAAETIEVAEKTAQTIESNLPENEKSRARQRANDLKLEIAAKKAGK